MKDTRAPTYKIGDFVGFVDLIREVENRDTSTQKWFLVQVSDGLHAGDVDFLRRSGIDLYRPLMRTMKLVPKKHLSRAQRNRPFRPVRAKVEPFFPGYAFLTFVELSERWREIFQMTGVRGLVCANNLPAQVPWRMIEEIRQREVDGAVPSTTKLMELPFILGERVRVANGPFASFPGTVERLPSIIITEEMGEMTLEELDDLHRVHLLVDIFGRQTSVALSLTDIEKI